MTYNYKLKEQLKLKIAQGNEILLEKMKGLGTQTSELETHYILKGFAYDRDTRGTVYGFAVKLNEDEKKKLLDNAKELKGNAIESFKQYKANWQTY